MSSDASNPNLPSRQFERYTSYRDLAVNYEGYSEQIPVRIPDISIFGMFINTPHLFPIGAVLNVRFTLTRSNFLIEHSDSSARLRRSFVAGGRGSTGVASGTGLAGAGGRSAGERGAGLAGGIV